MRLTFKACFNNSDIDDRCLSTTLYSSLDAATYNGPSIVSKFNLISFFRDFLSLGAFFRFSGLATVDQHKDQDKQ